MAVVLTESEKSLARQLGISEADVLKAKALGEKEQVADLVARAQKKQQVVLTPTELELAKALGISVADLIAAKTPDGMKAQVPEAWVEPERKAELKEPVTATERAMAPAFGNTEADLVRAKTWRWA